MKLFSVDRGYWTVFFDEEGMPTGFEHRLLGDEGGSGGLWFDENDNLEDYDGVYMLPLDVIELCEQCYCDMDYARSAMGEDELDDEPDFDDVWADSDALASAGWGTDEDYGG